MTTGALIFMLLSWVFVLGLTFWSFKRLLAGGNTTAAAETEPPAGTPPSRRAA